jgi:hypothetical protein
LHRLEDTGTTPAIEISVDIVRRPEVSVGVVLVEAPADASRTSDRAQPSPGLVTLVGARQSAAMIRPDAGWWAALTTQCSGSPESLRGTGWCCHSSSAVS